MSGKGEMGMSMHNNLPSTATQPDLDWSQVRETVRMLNLAVAQIEVAMREGDDSVETLTNSFTSMIESSSSIVQAVERLQNTGKDEGLIAEVEKESSLISEKMQAGVIAFQFYDKLSQRLAHVSHALAALSELVEDGSRIFNPNEWIGLQTKIRSKYSMREEQAMFDSLLEGKTVDEVLANGVGITHEPDNDIELF
ncbi:hypothetical protein [endosymbiont of Riftia pachyptila]|jgi:hypothetical protein|nr:hypothetical protein [endosymbiont of Riftia pachyptila]KRT59640.1 hypothetical protein Ga0076813_15853 [endosymbiont of Ridgeia piscesae]